MAQAGLEAELQEIDDLDSSDAEDLTRHLEELGPTFVKLGQLLSTRPDILPDPYLNALARLQDDVEPMPIDTVREVIEAEIDMPLGSVFADVDPEPTAAASLAQVHRAVLATGRDVALKVQRPGVRSTVRTDLRALEDIASLVDANTEVGRTFGFGEIVEQFRAGLVRELDFTVEADNLEILADIVAPYEGLVVPAPVRELTTRALLTMDFVPGRKVTDIGPLGRLDAVNQELVSDLMRAYLDQIMVHGFLHADPHPGNVLVTDDGRLALIDLGLVSHLGARVRRQVLELVLALAENRPEAAVQVAMDAGTPLPDFDRDQLERAATDLVSRAQRSQVSDMSAGEVIMRLSRACAMAHLRPPATLTLVGKALLSLDEVARSLAPDFEPHETLREHAGHLIRQHVQERSSPLRAAQTALAAARFMEHLPERAGRILEDLSSGDLTVRVDAFDQEELLRGLEKIATRLTVGVVMAAMVIGAALAMRVESDTTLLGAPAVAVVFFILSGLGGLAIAAHVLIADRRDRRRRRR